jgi:hypothetical protein
MGIRGDVQYYLFRFPQTKPIFRLQEFDRFDPAVPTHLRKRFS